MTKKFAPSGFKVSRPIDGEALPPELPEEGYDPESYLAFVEVLLRSFVTPQARDEWVEQYLPRTSAMICLTRRWLEASDLEATG